MRVIPCACRAHEMDRLIEGQNYRLYQGDCLDILPKIPTASVDAIITDPPYPEIDRPYGRMTEAEWHELMRGVVAECRRILKPTGSAVFILQPNSERVGRMRPWLWEFMAWTCRDWNMLQDVWWWNISTPPNAHAIQGRLMRTSLRACVWLGDPECFRNQDEILWTESEGNFAERQMKRFLHKKTAARSNIKTERISNAVNKRGGVTPFNVIPVGSAGGNLGRDKNNHSARTPIALIDWWIRFICPLGGMVLDPFAGSGTVPMVALRLKRKAVAIEKHGPYFDFMKSRLNPYRDSLPLFPDE